MAVKILDTGPTLTDEQLDNAMLKKLPEVEENVLMLLRHLHRRIQALEP